MTERSQQHASDRSVTVEVAVDRDMLMRLRPEAVLRDMPVARLINNLLNTIVVDKLTRAILDDAKTDA
jgi:hypothetical protein